MKKVKPKGKQTSKVKKDMSGESKSPAMMFVQRWIEFKGIKVHYTIDFEKGKISLIDPATREAKKWDFSGRSLDYMKGWLDIIDAMRFAVEVASKELKEYQDAHIFHIGTFGESNIFIGGLLEDGVEFSQHMEELYEIERLFTEMNKPKPKQSLWARFKSAIHYFFTV